MKQGENYANKNNTLDEAKQHHARTIEDQKLNRHCVDLKGLELQTTVSKLKLEVQRMEAACTQATERADWQEKNCQKMSKESLLAEKELLDTALQLETIKLTNHTSNENLKKLSSEIQEYKEK